MFSVFILLLEQSEQVNRELSFDLQANRIRALDAFLGDIAYFRVFL